MRLDTQIIFGLLSALIFFLVVPLGGAFSVRHRWRLFRKRVMQAYKFPVLDYSRAHRNDPSPSGAGSGQVREGAAFFGRLEGIQGETGVWLGSQGISVMLDLSRAPIFMLPQTAKPDGALPDTTPRVVMWKEMSALVEGSRFFVAGELERLGSDLTFSSWTDGMGPPLVIMYDCPDSTVLDRAMWTGRQRNEYWNHITPVSLIVGFLGQLLWVMHIFEQSRLYALIGTVAALVPVLPLLPPGVLGYYVYRKVWRWARRIRATRDVVVLRGLWSGKTAESLWHYNIGASLREFLAVLLLIAGMAVNAYIAALILAILLR